MIRLCGTAARLAGLGLALVIGGAAANAADLYNRGAHAPYDDPRYDYLYGRKDATPPPGWERRRYAEPRYDDEDPARLWRRRRAESHPEAWRDRYRYAGRPRWVPEKPYCPPKSVVRGRLNAQGWSGFRHAKALDDRHVTAEALHEDGDRYRLTLERCTGRLVEAQPIGRHRRYADDDDDFFERFDRDDWGRGPYAWQDDRSNRFVRPRGRF